MSEALKCDAVELNQFLATLADLFANSGCAREVSILAHAKVEIEQTDYDNWNGGQWYYSLKLTVPTTLYSQFRHEREAIEKAILAEAEFFSRKNPDHFINSVQIIPAESQVEGWRDRATAFLTGQG